MPPSSAAHSRVLVTGGAGFIGSCLIRDWLKADPSMSILCVDKLSYAGNLASLAPIADRPNYRFARVDICNTAAISALLADFRPTAIMHLAAESHVDRSIHGPADFVTTNVVGTFSMLEAARGYWNELPAADKAAFRFHHISTDEVFGSLGPEGAFLETTPYAPNSPYSATKAASDHLARAWHHTYGLPVIATNCSNNYGPYQFPEKLIPVTILNALAGKPLPVYGAGTNVRDWLYVGDHGDALRLVLERGVVGETYNVGGRAERRNIDVVHGICAILDELKPTGKPHAELIRYVTDRPGHDQRYAIDCSKIERELGWTPKRTFDSGLRETVEWYLSNDAWIAGVQSGEYRKWMDTHYADRNTGSAA